MSFFIYAPGPDLACNGWVL